MKHAVEQHDEAFLDWLSDVAGSKPSSLPVDLEYELVELTRRAGAGKAPRAWSPALVLGIVLTLVLGLAAPTALTGVSVVVLLAIGLVYASGMRVILEEHSGAMGQLAD